MCDIIDYRAMYNIRVLHERFNSVGRVNSSEFCDIRARVLTRIHETRGHARTHSACRRWRGHVRRFYIEIKRGVEQAAVTRWLVGGRARPRTGGRVH